MLDKNIINYFTFEEEKEQIDVTFEVTLIKAKQNKNTRGVSKTAN